MQGRELIDILAKATGLPEEAVREELLLMIEKVGKSPDEVKLDDIRHLIAEYLQDTILYAKNKYS